MPNYEGKDYSLTELPGFLEWVNKKSQAGGNENVIDSMFAMSLFLSPDEISTVTDDDFEEIYDSIESDLDE